MEEAQILIVEDEWIIYDDLAAFFLEKGFSVATYTKNYKDAIEQIKLQIPDLVLLDIDLDGEKDGIELGEELFKNYHIPFIYLSAFSDKLTLKRARKTQPETFLIKTKPQIDKEQLAVSIQMVLEKNLSSKGFNHEKEGILAYTDYYRDATNKKSDDALKTLCLFSDIICIETDTERRNYVIINLSDSKKAFYKSSLTQIKQILPFHFVRINTSQIVNLKHIKGKINHSSFTIGENHYKIGKNYSEEVHKILHCFYVE